MKVPRNKHLILFHNTRIVIAYDTSEIEGELIRNSEWCMFTISYFAMTKH